MAFNGYHHIGLAAQDTERSVRFYTEGLGGKITHSFPMGDSGKTIFMVDLGGNAVVEILPLGNGEPQANARWAHIAINTDDARAAYEKAIAAGAACQSAPKDMLLGDMPVCLAFVTGPDGEVIEFFEIK